VHIVVPTGVFSLPLRRAVPFSVRDAEGARTERTKGRRATNRLTHRKGEVFFCPRMGKEPTGTEERRATVKKKKASSKNLARLVKVFLLHQETNTKGGGREPGEGRGAERRNAIGAFSILVGQEHSGTSHELLYFQKGNRLICNRKGKGVKKDKGRGSMGEGEKQPARVHKMRTDCLDIQEQKIC